MSVIKNSWSGTPVPDLLKVQNPVTGLKQSFEVKAFAPDGIKVETHCPDCGEEFETVIPFSYSDSRLSPWPSPQGGATWAPSFGICRSIGEGADESWPLKRSPRESKFQGVRCGGHSCASITESELAKYLKSLDPDDDSAWTGTGHVRLDVIRKHFPNVSREDIRQALPHWNRNAARASRV